MGQNSFENYYTTLFSYLSRFSNDTALNDLMCEKSSYQTAKRKSNTSYFDNSGFICLQFEPELILRSLESLLTKSVIKVALFSMLAMPTDHCIHRSN